MNHPIESEVVEEPFEDKVNVRKIQKMSTDFLSKIDQFLVYPNSPYIEIPMEEIKNISESFFSLPTQEEIKDLSDHLGHLAAFDSIQSLLFSKAVSDRGKIAPMYSDYSNNLLLNMGVTEYGSEDRPNANNRRLPTTPMIFQPAAMMMRESYAEIWKDTPEEMMDRLVDPTEFSQENRCAMDFLDINRVLVELHQEQLGGSVKKESESQQSEQYEIQSHDQRMPKILMMLDTIEPIIEDMDKPMNINQRLKRCLTGGSFDHIIDKYYDNALARIAEKQAVPDKETFKRLFRQHLQQTTKFVDLIQGTLSNPIGKDTLRERLKKMISFGER